MADGISVYPVADGITARVTRQLPPLPPDLDAKIDLLWQAAQTRTGGKLFNGRVFSVDEITPAHLTGHFTEFRRIVAQMAEPALFGTLQIRSLAVCGVVRCADGVVLGCRDRQSAYQAGMWQLPPAGSVDSRAARDDGTLDLRGQLLVELEEELGITAGDVVTTRPLRLIEHDGSHVLDLGYDIGTTLDATAVLAAHAQAGDATEYDPLTVVPWHRLEARVRELGPTLVPTARVLLRAIDLLPP